MLCSYFSSLLRFKVGNMNLDKDNLVHYLQHFS